MDIDTADSVKYSTVLWYCVYCIMMSRNPIWDYFTKSETDENKAKIPNARSGFVATWFKISCNKRWTSAFRWQLDWQVSNNVLLLELYLGLPPVSFSFSAENIKRKTHFGRSSAQLTLPDPLVNVNKYMYTTALMARKDTFPYFILRRCLQCL